MIRCERIKGCLSVEAQGVVIRDVAIACTSGKTGEAANGTGVIKIQDGASARIVNVAINGMKGVHACIWHQGTKMYAQAVNCSGANDGIWSWADATYSNTTGNHFTIRDSYFHDFTDRTSNGHIDGYQTTGAAYGLIAHNTYLMTSDTGGNLSDSAIAIWDGTRTSHNIVVRRNLIAGGGFSIYAEDYSPSETSPAGGNKVTDIRFIGNLFSTHLFGCVGNFGVWFPRGGPPSDGWHRRGNRILETGASVDGGNPTYQGHLCT
ncbi:MAG: hypothetical protein ACRDPI_05050 [Nocardioidaceae bacterium]